MISPNDIKIVRNPKAEKLLYAKSREWLMQDERSPGIHASEIMEVKMAYWKRKKPTPLPDRLVTMFLTGKVLHSFVLNAIDEVPLDFKSDAGSHTSDKLGIEYSLDRRKSLLINGPFEFKTSRSFYEPKEYKDLQTYTDQLEIYMVAEEVNKGQIGVLYLNLKDESGQTSPAFRCYDVIITAARAEEVKKYIISRRKLLIAALKKGNPGKLPNCTEWKCGDKRCDYWEDCRPSGRYGLKKKEWIA